MLSKFYISCAKQPFLDSYNSLFFNNHEKVEFQILSRVRKDNSRAQTLDFRGADLGLFRGLQLRRAQELSKAIRSLRTASAMHKDDPPQYSVKLVDILGDWLGCIGNPS